MPQCPACVEQARRVAERQKYFFRRFLCFFGFHKDQVGGGRYGYIRYECEACGREKLIAEE